MFRQNTSLQADRRAAPPTRRSRHWLAALATLGVTLLVIDLIVGFVIRSRMAAAVARTGQTDLHARIAFYVPPYGVTLFGVHLSHRQAQGRSIDLFGASRVTLRLERASRPAQGRGRFTLADLKIHNGYFFRQCGDEALEIDRINALVKPIGGSSRDYRVSIETDEHAPAAIHGAGVFHDDGMTLQLTELAVRAKLAAVLAQVPMRPSVQQKLAACSIGGTLSLNATGTVPLHDLRAARYEGVVRIQSASATLPDQTHIDRASTQIDIHADAGLGGARVTFGALEVVAGKTSFNLESGSVSTSHDGQTWKLADLLARIEVRGGVAALDRAHLAGRFMVTAAASGPMHGLNAQNAIASIQHEIAIFPRHVSVQPSKFPIPIDHINGGPIVLRAGLIRFDHLMGNYGGDQVVLDDAHMTLDDPRQGIRVSDLSRQIRIDGMVGTLICHQPGPEYPAALGKTVAQLRPSGSFAISGWYGINRRLPEEALKPKPDYFFHVSTTDGSFALTPKKAPITDIHSDATVSAMMVDIGNFRGQTLGGTIIATARIAPVQPVSFDGTATLYNVDVKTACEVMNYTPQKPIVGKVYFKANVSGSGPGGPRTPLQALAANGEFELTDGNFGDITTIRAAAEKVSRPDQSLDGEAAGVFNVRDEKVTLENCVVGNPMFGLQGSGTIGFDKSLDLNAVAAPLGDWQTALKQSNIPVVSDVGSDIAGAIQQLIAGAQRVLLWDIHITGTTMAPKVTHVPAPVLSQPTAAIFGQLIRGSKETQLIQQIRKK